MLDAFHPIVRTWFEERFGTPTEPQTLGWRMIAERRDVLVSAPTGSGKTLAAFLSAIDGLFRRALAGSLGDETAVVYVSPLRALGNDITRNLRVPLAEIRAIAAREGLELPDLRVAVRSGDTPAHVRQSLVRRPPHVLVTTPESLYLLLTSERGREALASTETVIVDEIHAIARDKRGAHLTLSLERLDEIAHRRPQRIGLSATASPIEEIARFLVGTERVQRDGTPRCGIVEVGRRRPLDVAVEIPRDELSSVASRELWAETYDRIAAIVHEHRATLVFVNTRRLAERAAHALSERLGPGMIAAHHGSLSRARRLDAEERLKAGALRAVVATASLELGIDIGDVDVVVQIGSPGAISVGLQRIGRAGHVRGGTPKGRLFPLSRDELVECAAFVRGIRRGRLERVRVRRHPLDILAQHVVAEAACGAIHVDRLFALARRAWPYRDLPRAEFDAVVDMLADGVATTRGRATALLHRDGVHSRVRGRRGARIAALTGGGAIPDTAQYAVVAEPEGVTVGQVDEDFAVETLAGDIFLLGTTSWRVRRVETNVVRVEDAHGAPPGVPFWNGEAPGRSPELSREVSDLRAEVEARLADPAAAMAWLGAEAALPAAGARQVVEYLSAGRAMLGALPTLDTLVAERFFDEAGGMQLVVHAPLGARTNRALGLALRKRFCRTFDFELQAAATDDGVLLSLGPQHAFPLETIFHFVTPATVDDVLEQAVLQAPMFGVRWRWNATRALAIPRLFKGRKMPPQIARMRAEDLLASVFPAQVACQDNAPAGPIEVPSHPLVAETLRDCLCEAMDSEQLRVLLERIASGSVRLVAVDTPAPSPLAHEILGARPWAYLDDAPLEERRARAVAIRGALPTAEASVTGALDAAAIAQVKEQIAPVVRDAEEAHDALLDLGVLPDAIAVDWAEHLDALAKDGRAAVATWRGGRWWVAAERVGLLLAAAPALSPVSPVPSPVPGTRVSHENTLGWTAPVLSPALRPLPTETAVDGVEAAVLAVVRGWIFHVGPTTAELLAERIGLSAEATASALLRLEAEGLVLRGAFLDGPFSPDSPHWCERSTLARIHRLTLGRLRREIEPVSAADLLRFLARWQHVAPGTKLHGTRGVAEVVGQLQGFHAAARSWERDLLSSRIDAYEPALLDELCFSGEAVWGRLDRPDPPREEVTTPIDPSAIARPRTDTIGPSAAPIAPAAPVHTERQTRRAALTRSAPVTLALREDLPWLLAAGSPSAPPTSGAQRVASALAARGACFLPELARATALPPREVEEALWDLVSVGLATCDGFAGLRQLLGPGRPQTRRAATSAGRWSLLRAPAPPDVASCPAPEVLEGLRAVGALEAPRASCPAPAGAGAGDPGETDAVERLAHQYLRRYGVVFRDLLARESAPPWRDLVRVYRTLEARGAIRGGRFVNGFSGEQFALQEAVDALRAVRRAPRTGERIELSASDPLNLAGILTPGTRVHPGRAERIVLLDGVFAPDDSAAETATVPAPPAARPGTGVAAVSGTAAGIAAARHGVTATDAQPRVVTH